MDPVDDSYQAALDRAGRLLAVRPRTEHELRARLAAAGCDRDAVDAALARLIELRMIDDAAFAAQWIEERARTKDRGPEGLRRELAAKGVAADVVDQALAEVDLGDEESRAIELAARLLGKVAGRPAEEQGRRLYALLVRRGFSSEAALAGARSALPPEGWD